MSRYVISITKDRNLKAELMSTSNCMHRLRLQSCALTLNYKFLNHVPDSRCKSVYSHLQVKQASSLLPQDIQGLLSDGHLLPDLKQVSLCSCAGIVLLLKPVGPHEKAT